MKRSRLPRNLSSIITKYRNDAAHVVEGGVVAGSLAGQLKLNAVCIAHVLTVDFVLQRAVLKDRNVRMLLKIFHIFLKTQIQRVHHRRIALAHVAV